LLLLSYSAGREVKNEAVMLRIRSSTEEICGELGWPRSYKGECTAAL
jgi:hypothetical protein